MEINSTTVMITSQQLLPLLPFIGQMKPCDEF